MPKLESEIASNNVLLANDELSRAAVMLLMREPFYGHLLSGLQRYFTSSISTLAVALRGESIQLIINPRFFLEKLRNLEERAAILKHEVLHVVLQHLFRQQSDFDPIIWNVAADLVVNQYIRPFKLPDGAILLDAFPDIGLLPEDTVENYYEALHGLRNVGRNAIEAPISSANLNKIVNSRFPSDHSFWGNASGNELDGQPTGDKIPRHLRDALKQITEDSLIKAYNRTINGCGAGTMPGWLIRQLDDLIYRRSAIVDWRSAIRIFSNACRSSQLMTTLQRYSKRFEPIDGLPSPPGMKIKRTRSLAVAVDTSGSIDRTQLSQFFAEILAIYRQGTRIIIIEIDAEIQRTYKFEGALPPSSKGGGGTSFEPVMKWLSARPREFDGCIFFTDGIADAPITNPHCKLLWVIAGGDGGEHLKYGRQILIR